MKTIKLTILFVFITHLMNGQSILERSFFDTDEAIMLYKFETLDLWQLNLKSEGEGFYWDCSNMLFLPVDAKFEISKVTDTNPDFKENTFQLTAYEGGSKTKAFELYSMNDHALLLRGYGFITENGSRAFNQYDKPYSVLHFPWQMKESFSDNHQFRKGVKTYTASGTLALPGRGTHKAIKIKDSYTDGSASVIEHSWYISSIPYPVIRVTERFQQSDSSSLLVSAEFFLTAPLSVVKDAQIVSEQHIVSLNGSSLLLNSGHSLLSAYAIDGSQLQILQKNDNEYSIESALPSHIFLILKDHFGTVSRHILPVLK